MKRLCRDRAMLMICDVQEKFAVKAYKYEGVIEASTMILRACSILKIPSITT
jgi:hypothetical protein